MTPEQAINKVDELEAQSREAIKAWCDDPSVQFELCKKGTSNWHRQTITIGIFDTASYYYRIAKPRKWYRVGKFKDGTPFTVYTKGEEHWQSQPNFEKWLDERKYYD